MHDGILKAHLVGVVHLVVFLTGRLLKSDKNHGILKARLVGVVHLVVFLTGRLLKSDKNQSKSLPAVCLLILSQQQLKQCALVTGQTAELP